MKCEGSKSENEPSPWWVSNDWRLRRDSRNPAAFALCQPGNLVEKCCQIVCNGSCSISFPFRAPVRQELRRAVGGEHVPSAASSYCPDNLLSLWLRESDSHISVIFTWMVLFPKMQRLFSHLETEPFLAWGLLYLIGRNILIDFSVAIGSLISICLIDVFPCCWSFFPSFILHMNISSGLSTLFTFSFVICWNLWQEELERIRTNKSKAKMCFICTFAVNPGYRIPLSIAFWLEPYVLQGRVEVRRRKSWVW